MTRASRLTPLDWSALLLILAVSIYVGIVNGHYSYDDAFITFRMAEHFAAGRGFVYNAGEWHLGSTAAGYGLLLGILSRLTGGTDIPFLAGLVSTLAILATGWLLHALGRAGGVALCGAAAGLFYVSNPMVFTTFGGEMPFQLAVIVAAFFAHRQGAHALAAVLAALAIVVRPDGVLAAGFLLAWDVASRRGVPWHARIPWREIAIGAVIVLPFAALSWYAYGSPLPATLHAKLAQRDSGMWMTYGQGLRVWVRLFVWDDTGPNFGFGAATPPLLWLWTAIGVAIGVWRYRVFWPLLAWAALFVLTYMAARIPFYHWYAAPAALGLSVLAACGLCALADVLVYVLRRQPRARTLAHVAPYAVLLLICVLALKTLATLPRTSTLNPTVNLYIHAGHWLAAHTPSSASVGYYEIGYIGFHSRRRMVDSLGLIDPAVSPAVVRHDFGFGFRRARPDYILEKRGVGLNTFLNEQWFKDEYRPRATLNLDPKSSEVLIVHERQHAATHTGSGPARSTAR